jgi:CubicO group peptidase (beta-lactamase class C family)
MINPQELASAIDQVAQEHHVSGAVVVAQDGEVLFEQAYGFASRQLNVPNTINTKFHIASVTKMFIAMAALILFEQGRIDLHEKPAAYLPELAALDNDMTLHHLLSHTSGVQDIYDVPDLRFEMSKLKHEQGDLLAYLVKLPQEFRPGERWSYSTTGYLLMGYLLERVTGLTFEELMKHYVLTPLGMMDTGLDIPRRINLGRATGYTVEDGAVVHADNDRLSIFEGPGELYATVKDLKKWCDALFACLLVSPSTLQLMFTPHAHIESLWGRPWDYGYGWFLGSGVRMHGGGTQGFCSLIRQYPTQKVSIIALLNSDHMDAGPIIRAVEPLLLG